MRCRILGFRSIGSTCVSAAREVVPRFPGGPTSGPRTGESDRCFVKVSNAPRPKRSDRRRSEPVHTRQSDRRSAYLGASPRTLPKSKARQRIRRTRPFASGRRVSRVPPGTHRDPSDPRLGPADPLPGWPTADALEWAAQRIDHTAQPGGWAAQPSDWGLPAVPVAPPGSPRQRWIDTLRRPWLRAMLAGTFVLVLVAWAVEILHWPSPN